MKNFLNFVCIIFILIITLFMYSFSIRITKLEERTKQLEKEVELLNEELQVHENVFYSYISGQLSMDFGGDY